MCHDIRCRDSVSPPPDGARELARHSVTNIAEPPLGDARVSLWEAQEVVVESRWEAELAALNGRWQGHVVIACRESTTIPWITAAFQSVTTIQKYSTALLLFFTKLNLSDLIFIELIS